jgi:hypothetical protein
LNTSVYFPTAEEFREFRDISELLIIHESVGVTETLSGSIYGYYLLMANIFGIAIHYMCNMEKRWV